MRTDPQRAYRPPRPRARQRLVPAGALLAIPPGADIPDGFTRVSQASALKLFGPDYLAALKEEGDGNANRVCDHDLACDCYVQGHGDGRLSAHAALRAWRPGQHLGDCRCAVCHTAQAVLGMAGDPAYRHDPCTAFRPGVAGQPAVPRLPGPGGGPGGCLRKGSKSTTNDAFPIQSRFR